MIMTEPPRHPQPAIEPFALHAVADACAVARAVQAELDDIRQMTKDDRSPVTVADFAVQAIIAMALRKADPDAPLVGEEDAAALRTGEQRAVRDAVVDIVRRVHADATAEDILDAIDRGNHDATAGRFWTLDPIDGTKGFLRGEHYAIALGRIDDGVPVAGVMGCPNLSIDPRWSLDEPAPHGVVFTATRGGGAWAHRADDFNSTPLDIHAGAIDDAVVRVCESVEAAHSRRSDTQRVLEHVGARGEPVRLDSQAKYAIVARGQADAYLRFPTRPGYREMIWDHAAGSIIATEAGAVVTDIFGNALDFSRGTRLTENRGIVCAAASHHGRIIDAVRALNIRPPQE